MAEQPEERKQEEQPPYTPASPFKRVLAWVGVIYMVAFVFLNVYPFFTGGVYLSGIAPLMVCPGAGGLLVLAVLNLRDREATYSRRASMAVLAAVCGVLLVVCLIQGIPPLLAGLGV